MKKIIAICMVFFLFISSASALSIGEAKQNFANIKADLDEKSLERGEKFVDTLVKKYNKKELEYIRTGIQIKISDKRSI